MKTKGSVKARIAKALAVLFVIIAGFAVFVYLTATKRYGGESTMVYISRGDSCDAMADSLDKALGEEFSSTVVKLWKSLPGEASPRSGAYRVNPGDRAIDVAKRLRNGRQTPVRITFNNVRTLEELSKKIDSQMDISADEFISAADSVYAAAGVASPVMTAHFLPDTYEVYWNEPADKLIERLESAYQKFWNDDRKAKAAKLGLTPEEVAILASIVEEETTKYDEQGKVARLYLNRLKKGMRLQSDPTVKFAVGDFSLRRILNKHLAADSPYNTYLHNGLPPGPIRIVERRSIDAVLDAPCHNYIYMCAKSDFSGYHDFTADYAAHLKNARNYQAALNARGIN